MDYYDDSVVIAGIFAFFGIFIAIQVAVLVGYYVLLAFSLMSFFRKVGVEPWIAWVPIYNYWKWLEVGGFNGMIALAALVPYGGIVTSVFLYIGMYRTGLAFGKDTGFFILGIFFPFVWAFMLGAEGQVYRPSTLAQYGYPPPRAGYGSVLPTSSAQNNTPPPAGA